jgi:hypothetical protein
MTTILAVVLIALVRIAIPVLIILTIGELANRLQNRRVSM